jgi:hypothetical protein
MDTARAYASIVAGRAQSEFGTTITASRSAALDTTRLFPSTPVSKETYGNGDQAVYSWHGNC